jgi:hypothetical protein
MIPALGAAAMHKRSSTGSGFENGLQSSPETHRDRDFDPDVGANFRVFGEESSRGATCMTARRAAHCVEMVCVFASHLFLIFLTCDCEPLLLLVTQYK